MVMSWNDHELKWYWVEMLISWNDHELKWSWVEMIMSWNDNELKWSWVEMIMSLYRYFNIYQLFSTKILIFQCYNC